jgi:single-stranded-DNA-specific exonuclease
VRDALPVHIALVFREHVSYIPHIQAHGSGTMYDLLDAVPVEMADLIAAAAKTVRQSRRVLAFSHIDADGISALAIVAMMLERESKEYEWTNVHQINSESILEVREKVERWSPDLVIFSDFGTGQRSLIEDHIEDIPSVEHIIILDHHLPQEDESRAASGSTKIQEINPWYHDMSGSYDLSGAGTAFLLSMGVSAANADLSELAIVGATGDLQDYYGKGFSGLNKSIIELAESIGILEVTRDLTFFGINTRPLPYLLQYATDPYLPGVTGVEEACFAFYEQAGVELRSDDGDWRYWTDLESEEKQRVIQGLFDLVLESYEDSRVAQGIIGDVITLRSRPERTEMRSAKEFSTLLNACGRNRRPEVGVRICMGDEEAIAEGQGLLQLHRTNLAMALRRLENDGYREMPGMYLVDDPETPDTIIGIVIGMAQGSRIIPIDKPVIGVSRNISGESQFIKISGRAHRSLVQRGLNLKEAFVEASAILNEDDEDLMAEAGGHPMAAGAFVQEERLTEFLGLVSKRFSSLLQSN